MRQEPSLDLNSSGSGGVFMARKIERPYRRDDDKSHLKCTHCGGTRHTKNECFKPVGYPDWWPDAKNKASKPAARNIEQVKTTGRTTVGQGDELTIDEQRKEPSVALTGVFGSREREGEDKPKNGPNEASENLGFGEDERGSPFKGIDNPLNKGGARG